MSAQLERWTHDGMPAVCTYSHALDRLDTSALAAKLREAGHEPVFIVVKEQTAAPVPIQQPKDNQGLIFVLFMSLCGVAIIAMLMVACHATPIINNPPPLNSTNSTCLAGCVGK